MRRVHFVLAAENKRLAAVRPAQQVFREIELRVGKEFRAGHAVMVDQRRSPLSPMTPQVSQTRLQNRSG